MNKQNIFTRGTILIVIFFVFSSLFGLYAQTAGPDKTVTCSTTNLEADDPAPEAGLWNSAGAAVVTTPGLYNSGVTGLVPGANVFTWIIPALPPFPFSDDVTIFYVPANAGLDQSVCETVLLNGSNPSPGTGYWTSSSATVIFDDSTSPTANVSNLPFGTTNFTWHVTIEACSSTDVVVKTNNMPQNVNAGPDALTCNGTFTFAATDPSVYGGTGQWSILGGSGTFANPTLYNTSVSGLSTGTNTFRWTETKGTCSDFDDIIITHNGVTATASNQNVCTNFATFNGNLPLGTTGQWSVIAGTGIITNTALNNTTVTNLNPNNNTFRWTLTKGTCINSVDINIFYNELNVDAGPDQNICGTSTTMIANVPAIGETGNWTLQAGSGVFTNSNLNNTTVTNIDGLASNVYRWTISKLGCTPVWDDVVIYNNALFANAGADQLNICNNSVNLNAISGNPSAYGGTGLWSTVSTASITTPSNYQTTAINIGPGTSVFRWTVTKNGCNVWDEMTVSRSLYFVSAGPDITICDNFTTLQGSNPGPGGTGTWSIIGGGPATIANVNIPNSALTGIQSFPITLRWTVVGGFGGCSGSDDVVITKTGMTQAAITGGDVDVACNTTFYNGLSAVNGPNLGAGESSLWYQAGGANIVFSAPINSTVTNLTNLTIPLQHNVVYRITNGVCTSEDTITVTTYNFSAVVDAGPDIAAGCSEWVTLGATPVSAPYIGTWTSADATSNNSIFENPNNPNTRVETNNPSIAGFDGTYSYRWTVVNGTCSSSDVVNVTNNWTAFAAISAGAPDYVFGDKDIYLCSGATITLWGHPQTGNSNSGGWEIPNVSADFTFTGGAGNVNCIPNTGTNLRHKDWNAGLDISGMIGDWDIIWHQCSTGSNNNCKSQDVLHFHVLLDMTNGLAVFGEGGIEFYNAAGNPLPFAGLDQNICGTSTTLNAVDPTASAIPNLTGIWTGPAYVTFSDPTDPQSTVFGLQPGPNTLTYIVSNGCSEVTDQVTINVWGANVTSAGEDQIICEDFTNLNAEALPVGSTGEWSIFSGGGIIADITSNTTFVSNLLPGENVFRWHVISAFCNTDDYVSIYSNKPSTPIAGPDRYFCGSGSMSAQNPVTSTDIARWSVVSGGASISDVLNKNAQVTPILSPTTLRWTIFKTAPNGLQCTAFDDAIVYNYSPTKPVAGIDQTVCNFATMTANSPAVNETGQWSFIQGSAVFADPTYFQTTVTGLDYTQPNLLIWAITGLDRPGIEGACTLQDTVRIISNVVDVNAGPDKLNLCSTIHLLDANCPSLGTGTWSVTSGSGVFSGNTCNATVTGLAKGTNILRWTVTYNGCPTIDEVTVVNNLPTTPNAGLDKTVCGTTNMAGNIPVIGTGTWAVISGAGTFVNPTVNTTLVNGLNYGANILVWSINNNGCVLTDTVNIWSDVVGADAGIDETVCTDFYTLNGNNPAPGIGLWTPAGTTATIVDPTNRNSNVTGMNPGPNIFRWTITNATCSTFDDVIITNNKPTTANAGLDQIVCDNFTNMNANVPIEGTGLWSTGSSTAIIANSSDPFTLITNLPSTGVTMFTWTITKGTCISSDNVQLQYISTGNSAGPNQNICTSSTVLNATDPAPGTGTWTLLAGSPTTVISNSTLNNSPISNLQPGETILLWTVTNAASCIGTDTVSIFNNGPYPVNAGPDKTICQSSTNLEASPLTVGTGKWTTAAAGVTIQNPTLFNTLVSGINFGLVTFTWTATNGTCIVTDNVIIQNDSVNVADAGIDQYSCNGSTQLNAAVPAFGTGVWDRVQGLGNIVDPTLFNTMVNNLGLGRNVFRWTVTSPTSGCVSFDFVNVYNLPVNADAGPDQTTCDGTAVMAGNNPAGQFIPPTYTVTGYWQQIPAAAPGVIQNSLLFNTQISNLDNDDNVFRWTITNGFCTDWDEVTITNWEPTQAIAGPDTIICSTSLPNLYANQAIRGTGFWRVVAGSATIANTTLYNSGVTNLDYSCDPWSPGWWTQAGGTNLFEWVIDYNGCQSTDQVRVRNGLPQAPDAGVDQTVCAPRVNLDALDEANCTEYHWWEHLGEPLPPLPPVNVTDFYDPEFGGFIPDNDLNMPFNTHVRGLQNGVTSFVWHKRNNFLDSGGNPIVCHLTDTMQVNKIGDFDDVQAGTPDAVCENYYELDATDPTTIFTPPPFYVTTGQWSTIFGVGAFDDPTNHNTYVRNIGAQTNIYRWTVTNETLGCTMTDDVYIHSARPSAATAGPDNEICIDQAILSSNVPARFTSAYWEVVSGSASIINNSCTGFACDALATNIGYGTNVFVWHVINEYTGPYAGYSVVNPLRCELTDDLIITNSSVYADAGSNIYICADTAQLSANLETGETGQWLAGGTAIFSSTGGINSTLYNDVVTNLSRGKNTFQWTVTKGICSDTDLLVVWDNLPSPNPNAGFDQVICTDQTTLASNTINRNNTWYDITGTIVTQEGYSTQGWNVLLGAGSFDNSTQTNTWVRNVAVGDNQYVWNAYYNFTDYRYETGIPGVYSTFNQTCQLTDVVNIYNNSVFAEAGSNGFVCGVQGPGATYTLGATQVTAPMTGSWAGAPAPGATIVNPSLYNSTVTGMQNGDHIYHWTVSSTYNGRTCSNTDQVLVQVRIPTTALVAAPDTYEICEDFTSLRANIPTLGTGMWTAINDPLATIANPTNNVTSVTGISLGTRQFKWTINNDGCPSSDTLTVYNNMIESDADNRIDEDAILHGVAYNDSSICKNWYDLSATDPNKYNSLTAPFPTGMWTAFPGTVTFDNNTLHNTTVRNLTSLGAGISNLFWTVTKGGCTEISRLDITNNEFITDAHTANVANIDETCTGNFILSGQSPPAGGIGIWTIISGGGSFSNPSVYNTLVTGVSKLFSKYEWHVTNSGGCEAKDTVTIYNNSVTSNAGFDQTVCTNVTTLSGGPPKTLEGESGQWLVSLGGSTVTTPTAYNSGVTNMVQGQNRFVWRITRGSCFAVDEVEVINNEPSDFAVEADKEVCTLNSSISVNPPPPFGTGMWTKLAGGATTTIVSPLNEVSAVTDLQPGPNNIFQWKVNNNGCSKTGQIQITNNQVISEAGAAQFVCEDNAFLQAADPAANNTRLGTGEWSVITGTATVLDISAFDSQVVNLTPGLNTFRWTLEEGICDDFDDANVTNNSVSAIASNQIVCNNMATFDGNLPGSASGLWTLVGSSGTPVITTPTLNVSTVSNLGSGINTFRWTVSNAFCNNSIDIQINNGYFTISAGTDQAVCGTTTILGGEQPGSGNPGITGSWVVVAGGATVTTPSLYNSFVTGLTNGDNIFRWVVNSSICSAFDEVTIRNNSATTASIVLPIVTNREVCVNSVSVEGTNPIFGTGLWTISTAGATIVSPTNFQTVINNLDPGENQATWTITNGTCVSVSPTITITNNQVVSVAGAPQTICADNTFLNATNPALIYPNQGVGSWTNLSGNGAIIVNSLAANSQVTNLPIGSTLFRWSVQQGTCVAGSNVQVTNRTVTASATDLLGCASSYQLNGNDPGSFGGTGYWEIIAGSGAITAPSTQFDTWITGIPNGATSTLRWTVTNVTCTDDIQITVTNNNFTVNAGPDQAICTTTTSLSGDNPLPGTGTWSLLGGSGIFANLNSNSTNVTNISQGANIYRWTIIKNGCPNFDDVIVTNNSPSTAQITGPVVTETCTGTATLTANLPAPYYADTQYWELVSGAATFLNPSTSFTMNVSNLAPGANIFRWTVSRGTCTPSTATITITNNRVTAVAGNDQTICTNNTFLNATKPSDISPFQGTGYWTDLSGTGALIVNSLSENTQVINLANGATTFSWTVEKGTCSFSDQVQITNSSVSAIASNISGCSSSYTLTGNDPSTFGGTGFWEILSGVGIITAPSTQYNTTITGLPNGATSTLRWTVSNGICNNSTSITVTNNNFNVSAGSLQTICTNNTTLNGDNPSPGTGVWSLFSGSGVITTPTNRNSTVTGILQGTSVFTWTVTKGVCSSSANVSVINNSPSTAIITGPLNTETCDGTITLSANLPAPYYADTQYWTQVTGSGTFLNPSTSFTLNVSNLSPGINRFRWSVVRGTCPASTALIDIVNNVVLSEAGPGAILCTNTTNLSATSPGSMYPFQGVGHWTNLSGNAAIISNSLNPNTLVSNLPVGTTNFLWTVELGTCSIDDLVLITNSSVTANASNAQTCDGNVTLAGNNPGPGETGIWTCFTPGVTFDNATLYNTGAHNLVYGNNTFEWTITNGICSNFANINVNFIDPIAFAGANQNLCKNSTFMTATNPSPGTGVWSVQTGSGTFVNPSTNNTFVTGIGVGTNTYVWTVNDRGCIETSSVTITNNLPSALAGSDQVTCDNFAVLAATQQQVTETGLWTIIGGAGIVTTPTLYNSPVTNLSPGINVFQWTVNNGTCSKSDEVSIYNNQITSISAGLDRTVCTSSTTLAALAPGGGQTGSWDALSGSAVFTNSALYNTVVTNLSQGDNVLQWTLSNGTCSATDNVTITNNSPTIPVVSPDVEICSSIYTLLGNAPGVGETGLWTNEFGAQGTIANPSNNITTVSLIGLGANTFRWTISNANCSAYDDIIITNNTIITDAGIDVSLCTDTAALSADNPAPGTGIWSIVNSGGVPVFDDATVFNTTIRNLGPGSNILRWTTTKGGCSAWDIVTITNDVPTTANAGLDRTVCNGTVNLAGNNPTIGTGLWTRLGGAGTIANPSNYNTLVTGLGSGGNTFRWTITKNSCISYDDVLIMNQLVYASAGMDDEVCGTTYPDLNGNQPGVGESGVWTVSGGSGVFTTPSLYNTGVSGLSGAENRFTWTVTRGGCSSSDDVSIFNNTPSPASVSSNKQICLDYTVISGNPPTTGVGAWSVAAGSGVFDNSLANTTTVRFIGPDINQYKWTITEGTCTTSAVITVTNNSVAAIVGETIETCGTTTWLNGNEPQISLGQTGLWTVTAGTGILVDPSKFNSQVTTLNKGENKFRWTLTNGSCTSYTDLLVINNLYDAFASIAGTTPICVDSANLLGNIPISGSTGQWSVWAGGGTFSNASSPTSRVYGLLRGDNTLRWTITKNGCNNYDEVVITNNMVQALAGSDIVTCGNNPTLVANKLITPPENGMWTLLSGAGTIVTPTLNTTTVTGLGAGVNVFRWSVTGNGCTAQDEVQISENSFVTSAGFNQSVCNTTVALQAQDPSPGTGIWSFSGPGVTIVTPTLNTTTVTGLQDNSPHTFRWTVSKNGCSAWDEVIITNNLVHANAGGDQSVCVSTANLAAQNPIAGNGFWTITSGAGSVLTPTYFGSQVIGLGLGTNTLNWTVTNLTCVDADQMIITNNTVTATAGLDQASCFNYTYLSGDQPLPGGYGLWTTAGGSGVVQTPSLFNSYVSALQRGYNTFRWTVYQNGCNNGGDLVQIINNDFDAYAGEDQTLPALVTLTNFTATLPVGGVGQWSILAGSGNIVNLNSPTSEVNSLPTGANKFTWSVNMPTGCSDSDDVTIIAANFNPEAGPNQIICTNTTTLNAVSEPGATSQSWSIVTGGGVFADRFDPKTVVTNIPRGANVYKWTVRFVGYTASDVVLVTNDSIYVAAGPDAVLCETTHQMNAQQILGGTGLWTIIGLGSGNIVTNTAWNTVVTDLGPGTNLFEWYADNGNCQSRDTVAITYNLPPIAQFTTNPTVFCSPADVLITNTSNYYPGLTEPDEYRWSIDNEYLGTTYVVTDNLTHTFTNTGTLDSIFNIRLVAIDYESGCTDTFSSSITAMPVPHVEFSPSTHIKRYPDATFGFENLSSTTLDSYLWQFGNGDNAFQNSYVGYLDYEYSTWGTFVVTLTGTSGGACDAVYRDTIVILPPCPYSYDDASVVAKGCEDLTVDFYSNISFADSIEWRFYGDNMFIDQMSNDPNPVYTYTEAGTFFPIVRAWSNGCDQVYKRRDTVIVYPAPIADFDVSPRLVLIPRQAIHCYNYSQFGDRYLWDLGDTISTEEEPIHYYTEPGVYNITLSVWTDHDCFDTKTIENIVFAEEPGMIKFPNAFTPNHAGPTGGAYPCGGNRIDTQNLNDIFYPLYSGVIDYELEIYNRWGEKLFISNDICIGWDGYVDGKMAPQDVYVWKVSVIYKNGEPYKEYGSVTLLR